MRGGKHGIFISLNINFSFLCFYSARCDEDLNDEGLLAKLAYVFMKNIFSKNHDLVRSKQKIEGSLR